MKFKRLLKIKKQAGLHLNNFLISFFRHSRMQMSSLEKFEKPTCGRAAPCHAPRSALFAVKHSYVAQMYTQHSNIWMLINVVFDFYLFYSCIFFTLNWRVFYIMSLRISCFTQFINKYRHIFSELVYVLIFYLTICIFQFYSCLDIQKY